MENEDQLNGETENTRLTGNPRRDIVIYGEKARFTSDKQPSPEAKSKGKLKAKRNRKLAQLILSRTFIGKITDKSGALVDSKFRKTLKDYFGLEGEDMEELSNEAAIMMRLIGNATENGDAQSAAILLERAYGKPKEMTPFDDPEMEEADGSKPQIVIQIIQQSDLPPIKENEDEQPDDTESI